MYPSEQGDAEAELRSESGGDVEKEEEDQEVVLSGAEAHGTSGFM